MRVHSGTRCLNSETSLPDGDGPTSKSLRKTSGKTPGVFSDSRNAYPMAMLVVGDREWAVPAAVIFAVAVAVLLRASVRTGAGRRTRVGAALPKAIGFGLLAVCLVDPHWAGVRAKPGENLFVLLADDSASLTIRSDDGRTRGQSLRDELMATESPWQVRLAQDFDVRRYQFDARLSHVEAFDSLEFAGTTSAIDGVLASLAQRFRGQPLAGVLLFTDGNSTDSVTANARAAAGAHDSLPPVYPVLPPVTEVPPDLSITRASVSETVFEDAPVTVQAEVVAQGVFEEGVVVELRDEAGNVIEQTGRPISDGETLAVRFQVRPTQPDLRFYTVRVIDAAAAAADSGEPRASREATLANNSRVVAANREGRPYRVLYVAGRPNWEYRFLHRALRQDEQVQLVALIRIARKEAKFDFRGRADESSNPLFRGFKKDRDEETESYDEPVLIRQGTRDEAELREGFPQERSLLYEYDAIILDDVEASFFTHDQLVLIERFVAERGGGLMMLGGIGTFQHGGYARTPVADALPVYLDRNRSVAALPADGFRLTLTRDGWLQPWMRLRSNEPDEQQRLSAMPSFVSVTRAESVKPGARVMALLETPRSQSRPAIVSQRYGAGRTLAVLIGDLWRWQLRRAEGANDDLAKMWRQSVRWLVADVPRRLEVSTARTQNAPRAAVELAIRVRDREFQPQENADLHVAVRQPDGEPISIVVQPSLDEPGLFTGSFVSRQTGGYRAEVTLTDADGEPQRTVVGWTSNPAAEEFRNVGINRQRMESLAEETGGEVVAIDGLETFVSSLPLRRVPITETWTSPLWDRWWVFLLVVACLAGEWGFRRLRGLP